MSPSGPAVYFWYSWASRDVLLSLGPGSGPVTQDYYLNKLLCCLAAPFWIVQAAFTSNTLLQIAWDLKLLAPPVCRAADSVVVFLQLLLYLEENICMHKICFCSKNKVYQLLLLGFYGVSAAAERNSDAAGPKIDHFQAKVVKYVKRKEYKAKKKQSRKKEVSKRAEMGQNHSFQV